MSYTRGSVNSTANDRNNDDARGSVNSNADDSNDDDTVAVSIALPIAIIMMTHVAVSIALLTVVTMMTLWP